MPLPASKAASTREPLEQAPLPGQVILPLEGAISSRGIRPAIKVGQRVLRHQPLVSGGGPLGTWTHATTSGIVRSIETLPIGHPRRLRALCAVIDVDGEDETWPQLHRPDPRAWDTAQELATALSRAGLAGLGGAVFPTGIKLAASWRRSVRAVIINGAECEPYISCDDMLMRTSPREVLAGAQALLAITGAPVGYVALEEDKPEALAALERALIELGAEKQLVLLTVPTVYPSGGERQLIQLITGDEVPSGGYPTDIGYLCQNAGTAAALYRFLQTGEPLTRRITTVTGEAVARPGNLEVRLGTPVSALIAARGGYTGPVERLILGGAMTGIALEDDGVPVTHAANCVIAAGPGELVTVGGVLPCIRCGACSEVCPAILMPQLLHREAKRDRFGELERLSLFDCIECGCCDVVCPSHIPLVESFRDAKRRLVRAMDRQARARWFEARQRARQARVELWEARHSDARSRAAAVPPSPDDRAAAIRDILSRTARAGASAVGG